MGRKVSLFCCIFKALFVTSRLLSVGFQVLGAKIEANGPRVLFAGSIATCLATVVGHYPWFLVYNSLSTWLPSAADVHTSLTSAADISGSHPQAYDPVLRLLESVDERFLDLARSAFIGLCASCTSDICSNSLRYCPEQPVFVSKKPLLKIYFSVLKTYRQSSDNEISYQESIAKIVSEKGWASLFGRGLKVVMA